MRGTSLQRALGDRLRTLRKEKGWTLDKLGHITGLNGSYIGEIERGLANVTLESLKSLSDGLNTTVAELFLVSQEVSPQVARESNSIQVLSPGRN